MSKEMEFFIFLLESYAAYKNTTADEVLKLWDELKLTDFIYDMYERYHIERIENAFEDIDRLIAEKIKRSMMFWEGIVKRRKINSYQFTVYVIHALGYDDRVLYGL